MLDLTYFTRTPRHRSRRVPFSPAHRTRLVDARSFPYYNRPPTSAATLPWPFPHVLAPPYQPWPPRGESLRLSGGKLCVIPHSSYLNPNLLVFRADCRWRLPLWLLLFSGMVSVLTLSYLLTGTVYPNSWTRFSSESLGMLTAVEGFYSAGQQDDAASRMLEPVSHAAPDHVFARISRSGEITMAPRSIGRPSSCGPATLVDNTVRSALRHLA